MGSRTKFYLDRFEGDFAVLLVSDQEIIFPRNLLPAEARAGDHLSFSMELDPLSRDTVAREISDAQKRLREKDGSD